MMHRLLFYEEIKLALLCTLKNINLTFGNKHLFNDASFNISLGDRIGLLGLNGQGKSSLFKILSGSVKPDISTPPFQFDQSKGGGDSKLAYSSFLVPQELPLEINDNITVKEYFFRFYPRIEKLQIELDKINNEMETCDDSKTESLLDKQKDLLEELDHLEAWNLISSYESYLRYFNIKDQNAKVIDLSGGEQKKILLSLGLSCKANLVLWDEPTNHLDLETIKLFEEELANSSKTYMIISHDRYLLSKVTSKIYHIQRGSIETFEGSYPEYLEYLAREEESRKVLLTKLKNSMRRETAWMRQGIKARGTRSKKRVDNYHELKSSISELKSRAKKDLEMSIHESGRKTRCLVDFKSVNFSYDKETLFENVNFSLYKGDKIGLVGANGVGKSTLIHLILNRLSPVSGNIKTPDDLQIQYFSQKREELDPEKTPYDILGEGSDHVTLPNGAKRHVAGYFDSFLFNKDELHRPLKTFSGGERNRLQMALNLLRPADLWIFDEPTNDLDLETLQILEEKLTEFEGSIILISHDRTFLSNITNKVWLLQNKTIESFVSGYEHAEAYIDALTLENIMENSAQEEEQVITSETVPSEDISISSVELSNKEKSRLKELPLKIEELEKNTETIRAYLATFDFNNMDEATSKDYGQFSSKLDDIEENLLELYEELESLESKQ
jgi:ATP-binding cassette subfamily F protein uup